MEIKIKLNTTTKSSQRYYLLNQSQGSYNTPAYYPNHCYCVVSGSDRGNGYQGYYSIDYFLTSDLFDVELKKNLIFHLENLGYQSFLNKIGVI